MDQRVYARYFIGLLLFGVVLSLIPTVRFLLFPLILSGLFAVILIPLANKLESFFASRNINAFICVGIAIAIIVTLLYILTVPLLKSAKEFLISLPTLLMGIQNRLGISKIFSTLGIFDAIVQSFSKLMQDIFGIERLVAFIYSTFKWLYVIFLTPVLTFYLLRDRREIQKAFIYFFPFDEKGQARRMFKEIYTGITTYVYGYLFISLICMGMSLLAFSVINLDSFLFLSFFMGVCSFIPFIGPFIGGIPAIIVASNYGWRMWYVIAVIIIIFQFTGSILTPKTIGNSVNVHPVFGILAMVLGYGLFGVVGIILAIPIFVVLRPIFKYIFTILTTNSL